MGRPTKKENFGNNANSIRIITNGPTNTFIIRQRGVNKFEVGDDGTGNPGVVTLTNSTNPDLGFGSIQTFPFGADDDGAGAVITSTLGIVTATVAAGGDTYSVGDDLVLTGGTRSTAAIFNVSGTNGNAVTAVDLGVGFDEGSYTVIPGNPVSTTGSGDAAATLTVVWGVADDLQIGDGGGDYDQAPTLSFVGGGGAGAVATAGVGAGAVNSTSVTDSGTGYTTLPAVVVTNAGTQFVRKMTNHLAFTESGDTFSWNQDDPSSEIGETQLNRI